MIRGLMDSMPLWGLLITTIIIVSIAIEIGYRIGVIRSRIPGYDNETQFSSITGAHFGLLAFILAFSFNMAAGHFNARKDLMLEDANAIETAYLRAGLVAPAQGGEIKALLSQYTTLRAQTADLDNVTSLLRESNSLKTKMWQQIEQLPATDKLTIADSLLIQSINAVFDIHEKRVSAGLRSRIPPSIWIVLYVVLVLSMVGMGFYAGVRGKRSPIPNAAMALSFSMVMYLIADLDRPVDGMVTSNQVSLVELSQRLNQPRE
ncbi:MAG: hypothetical protein HOC23_19310 [Halieaceae bacterium]|nr:hypothetical protein [Halieaceae bacterium]